MMHKPEIEDLQFIIHQLKKDNLDLRSENQLLKVKVRKLHDEFNRKSKQLDSLLDPRKNSSIAKMITRQGAALIVKLKEENFEVYKKLAEKDLVVKKLQSDIETTKLYINDKVRFVPPNVKLFESQESVQCVEDLNNGHNYRAPTLKVYTRRRSKSVSEKKMVKRSRSTTPKESISATDLQIQKNYLELLNNNLQKIKECGNSQCKVNKTNLSNSATSNKSDAPHEEIQQLQSYLLNVLNEVDSLKSTITELKNEQNKTSLVLSEKSTNINKLVSDIAKKKVQQVLNNLDKKKSSEVESTPEPISTDIGSSKCSTCEYTGESDYTETTTDAGSTSTKSSKKSQHPNIRRNKSSSRSSSKSIQTERSFCSKTFTPVLSKHALSVIESHKSVPDENVDFEYIN